ncbi:MAG: helix-turn-helix domain-containing protein, partial [Candidatus Dojkabacteria bacterium]|nr:helix-turn-helix domain-containing protein [Candidatus Dojkabacteria bacterium]
MSITKSLENLDLTHNEIEVYTFLLRNGKTSGANLVALTNIDKGSVYRSLKSLIKKGIISSTGKTRNQIFIPRDPTILTDILKEKKIELARAQKDLNLFINDIDKYAKENYKTEHIQVFEGHSGYKLWIEQRLKRNVDLIREIAPLRHIRIHFKDYYKFMGGYIERRVKKGIKLNVLIDNSEDFDHIDRTNEEFLKEARRLDAKLNLHSVFTTFGAKTGFFSNKDNKFIGITIEDKFITNMLSSMYDFLWNQAKIIT